MFQRLKGVIDSKIAEEQARQRTSNGSPSRSSSGTQRSSSRTDSPSRRAPRTGGRERRDGDPPPPFPSEFESEFVIGGDDVPSRSATPRPVQEKAQNTAANGISNGETPEPGNETLQERIAESDPVVAPSELPTDVRVKLRKLEKLESKYNELLKAYRLAHARVLSIEPFETSLRENTPLTSIGDPGALVEYLNQINLKGDMVLDELKRISSERDTFKQRLSQAEQSTKEAWDEVANLKREKESRVAADIPSEHTHVPNFDEETLTQHMYEPDPLLGATVKSPSASTKSRTPSIRSLSIFSPRTKPAESPVVREGTEDIFSYDSELPRLESELKEGQDKISVLQNEVKTLKGDLAVARESTQSMVQSLEQATREFNSLRESKDRSELELEVQRTSSEKSSHELRANLHDANLELKGLMDESVSRDSGKVAELEENLLEACETLLLGAKQDAIKSAQVEQLEIIITERDSRIEELTGGQKQSEKRVETLNGLVKSLKGQVTASETKERTLTDEIDQTTKRAEELQRVLEIESKLRTTGITEVNTLSSAKGEDLGHPLPSTFKEIDNNPDASVSKKKNKRKKKGGKPVVEQGKDFKPGVVLEEGTTVTDEPEASTGSANTMTRLQTELEQLRALLIEKDAAIDRIHGKLKEQDELREEIETLRDDIINVGQEHVQAKDTVKELMAEKAVLETTVKNLEKELAELHGTHASSAAGTEERHRDLAAQFEELKSKATTMQTDLSAAQQLASSRFKDLSDLKNVLQKAQPELTVLRSEVSDLQSVRETLGKRTTDCTKLEARHEEMRAEVTGLKQTVLERDSEIKTLNQKISQEQSGRLKAEDSSSNATQEIQRLSTERRQATESLDRLSKDLAKSRDDLVTARTRLKDLEQQTVKLSRDNDALKEDIELKTAQHASAQSLMGSMRDQTAEMAMQMKEARGRCEGLDEEVADAHRLLGERSREGETMRRLLADVEGRADSRLREMKERMDTAIEERDRAEDEASTAGRRRARELEDLRSKVRDAERSLKRAEEDKEELDLAQRDWKRRREDLEQRSEQSTSEAEEVRNAMDELRDALDESERQARELEKQKAELQKSFEDTQHRFEKLQKSNKSMTDEIRTIQTTKTKAMDSETPSSRSSKDFNPLRARLGSPTPGSRTNLVTPTDTLNGQGATSMDYIYLKNVLLQFLEQKDKKHQMQLIPVLGMLLHFDRKDEQRWMSAITTK